jgi:DNA-binding NarL/FixJ family response regulator
MTLNKSSDGLHLLVVDDHIIVRQGLAKVLESYKGVTSIDQANNGLDALELLTASKDKYALIITDIRMHMMGGIELIRLAKKLDPGMPIIALTVDADVATAAEALEAGARAYMLKNSTQDVLFKAIDSVLAGNTYVDDAISGELINYMRNGDKVDTRGLSPREMDVLRCIADEMSNAEAANKLFISERTVETHRKSILRKTGVKSVIGLVLMAKEKRWV